jgi:hypothetical protein
LLLLWRDSNVACVYLDHWPYRTGYGGDDPYRRRRRSKGNVFH